VSDIDYDLFVIGAGSGGVRAARMAASFGAKVAIAEEQYMGGTCVNVGCVPKKLYVYASEFGKGFSDAREFGWHSEVKQFDWATLRDNKKTEISRLNAIYRNLLSGVDADVIDGRATIVNSNTVAVGEPLVAGRIYRTSRARIWLSAPTKFSTWLHSPNASSSWAVAISLSSSPEFSMASVRGSPNFTGDRCSCVGSTPTSGPMPARRYGNPALTCASKPTSNR
jgi:hypothetical protein